MLGKNLCNKNDTFLHLIFLWIFYYKKLGILEVFGHRRPQFSSDLSDIWLESWTCTTILPTKLWGQNFDFLLLFFYGFSITKKGKIGNFGGFWPFSHKVFYARPWNLASRHIVGTFKCVWKLPLWVKFLARFWPRIGPKYVNMWVFFYFLENFPRNHRKLYLLAHWS